MYGGELCHVRLSCDNSMAGIVIDRFGTDIVIANHGDRFEFTVKVMISPTFYSWVLGFGNKIKIVSPDFVRERAVAIAQQVIDANEIK